MDSAITFAETFFNSFRMISENWSELFLCFEFACNSFLNLAVFSAFLRNAFITYASAILGETETNVFDTNDSEFHIPTEFRFLSKLTV